MNNDELRWDANQVDYEYVGAVEMTDDGTTRKEFWTDGTIKLYHSGTTTRIYP